MSKQRYPEEFKIEVVKQITERGHKMANVSTPEAKSLQECGQIGFGGLEGVQNFV
jgi:hypothetical protein